MITDPTIVGAIHAKDLFRAVKAAGSAAAVKLEDVMTPPWFIPESTILFDQLQAFRARHGSSPPQTTHEACRTIRAVSRPNMESAESTAHIVLCEEKVRCV